MPLPFSRRAPQTAPSFSRDFAGLKTLDHGVGPAIKFERASDATYFDASGTLQTAGTNVPRFDHDPATGASRGLLIEEARTNLLTYSSEFDNAAWAKNLTVVTADQETAPDGAVTADLIDASSETSGGYPAQSASVTANAFTASVFAKKGTTDFLRIRLDTGGGTSVSALFDVDSGTAGTTSVGVTSAIQAVGNGWYRCAATYTFASAASRSFAFQPATAINNNAPTGTLYLWGAQVEQGAFPTSYVPTTSAAATRAADSAVVTPISSFYNQAEGTLFAEASVITTASGTFPYSIALDDNTNNNRIELYASTTSSTAVVASSGSQQALTSFSGAISAGVSFRAIVAVKADDIAFSTNGQPVVTDTAATMPVGVTQLRTKPNAFVHIRKIAYWPRRLSDALLQQLTT